MKNSRHRTSLIAVFVVAATLTFVGLLLYWSWGSLLATLTSSTSPSPSPANATQSPPPANQNSAAPSQSSPKPDADRSSTDTVVRGTVTKGGEAVTGAVVVLFNGDRRGAEPQKVNENGQFRFANIPVRSDASYSLQTKVPGLCGEKSFTSVLIDAQETINVDIELKPCQTDAPSPVPGKTEVPGLASISEGLTGIVEPLNSMKSWVKNLTITYILTILALLLATAGLIFLNRRQVLEDRDRIKGLVLWRQTVEGELKKLTPPPGGPPTTTLVFPTDVLESLRQVRDAVTTLASKIQPGTNQTGNSDFEPEQVREKTSPKTFAPAYGSYNSPTDINDWYRKLLQNGDTFPAPRYVQINSALSETSMLSNTRQICFDEGQNHGPFVIYENRDGEGWIFPSPGSNFTADHHRVFDHLDQKNFDQQRANIIKKPVILQEGHWRLVL